MPSITYSQLDGTSTDVQVEAGTNLMRAAVSSGIEGIIGECGGQAMCATCHIYISPQDAGSLPEVSEDEDEMLDCTTAERTEFSRLGCQVEMGGTLERIQVTVPGEQG